MTMQTFLPYKDIQKTVEALDWRRLGKQRVETLQLLRALRGETTGWRNHPAAKMWEGYEYALAQYGMYVCREWRARGYDPGKTEPQIKAIWREYKAEAEGAKPEKPPWFGKKKFHKAHRRMLAWKKPEHYMPIFKDINEAPTERPEYWWPV